MRRAYQKIFERLGLEHTIVAAVSGAMGGSASEEFLAMADVGEDTFVGCTKCDYAANTEAVTTPAPPAGDPAAGHPPAEAHDTPDTPTIATLVALANARGLGGRADWTAADTLKNVVVRLRHPGADDAELLVVGVPGDRDVDLKRLGAVLAPAAVELFDDWSGDSALGLVRGYIGPQILAKLGVRYLVDPRVVPGTAWLTGANEPGRHAVNVVCGRDFVPDGTVEAADVRAGDPCPRCGGALTIRRGIEVGHIFQLGRRYTDVFGLDALGPDGKPIRVTMGCYGVGVSRLVASIVEQHCDERGLAWPGEAAPCDVHLVPAGGATQRDAAAALATDLAARGLRVLLDDRDGVSAGVKFTDAELIGIPRAVVVGRRYAEGYVELRDRATGERTDVPYADVAAVLGRPDGG